MEPLSRVTCLGIWSAFVADHPDQVPEGPMPYAEYMALMPAFGQRVIDSIGADRHVAHLLIESVWSALTDTPAHREQILVALLRTGLRCWGLPFDTALGYDGIVFPYPAVLEVLALDPEEDVEAVTVLDVVDEAGVHHAVVTLTEVINHLSVGSALPEYVAYWDWMCTEFMPAIMRHGYYDSARNHEPPPGQEVDALERQEGGREVLNALVPGLGDMCAGERPSTEEGRRLLWHRVVDDEGHAEWVNDADLPDAEDEEALG